MITKIILMVAGVSCTSCDKYVARLKEGPVDYEIQLETMKAAGTLFTDT